MRKALVCSFVILLSLASVAYAGQITARFGILKHVENGFEPIIKETTTIPYLLKNDATAFGVNIDNPTADAVQYKIVLISPGPAIDGACDKYSASQANTRFESPTFTAKPNAKVSNGFWLDKGDPHGEWKIQVFVGGALLRNFDVTILPPQ